MDRILDRQKLDGLEEKPVYLTIDLDYFDPRSFRRPAPGAGRRRVVADAGFLDH
jgi:arginase family enzyme